MGLFKGLGHYLVFLGWIGKVAELQQGIGLFFLHGIEEGLEPDWSIVHHALMQIGDHAELDGTFDFRQRGHDLPGQQNGGSQHAGNVKEVTPWQGHFLLHDFALAKLQREVSTPYFFCRSLSLERI